ncbi:MAG TPA: ATP-binding cassette domain-containing protein [Anaerolineales bacterium]
MPFAIETFALTKQFPRPGGWRGLFLRAPLDPPAVDGVDLRVQQGELFGLLGPNGAGKTTLIKLLSTLVIPTSGRAPVNGYPLQAEMAIKRSIGLATSDERSFYWRLSGMQNLEFFGALHGLDPLQARERAQALLEQVGLSDKAGSPFQTYSTGMRQRLIIARALINQPRLLFLDEPTRGLDPGATRQVQTLVRELCDRNGITVFLTTHNLQEARLLCSRIAILDHGQVRACGTLAELGSLLDLDDRYRLEVSGLQASTRARLEQELDGVQVSDRQGGPEQAAAVEFTARDGDGTLDRALELLREGQSRIDSIAHESPALRLEQPAGFAGENWQNNFNNALKGRQKEL